MMRREFITLLGGAAASWPLAAGAQQPAMPIIGWVSSTQSGVAATDREQQRRARTFHQGLRETGYVDGQNVTIEYRGADGQYDRLPGLVRDLVQRQVTIIVAGGIPAALAAKATTTTIPLVFYVGGDPVELGLVGSLNRPGGNLTGVTVPNAELGPKRLELLHELAPAATTIALLVNPTNRNAEAVSTDLQAAARKLGLQLHILRASTDRELDTVFATLAQLRAGGLVISPDGFFVSQSEQLAALTVRHAVPAIFQFREFAAAGGLMSYGASAEDAWRLIGTYAGRILKGEKPADLPVQQPTKYELVINLKTSKALGLTVPLIMQMTADEVIE
jgi:putative tryptophan/tyrosine transport system substrate-binding protein